MTDYSDAHFKLLPFLNELSYNFLLGLDFKNFRRYLKQFLMRLSQSKASKTAMYGFFLAMVKDMAVSLTRIHNIDFIELAFKLTQFRYSQKQREEQRKNS